MSAFVKTLMVGTILASGVSLAAARGVGGVGGVAAGASSNTSANAGCDASDASDRTGHASPDAGRDIRARMCVITVQSTDESQPLARYTTDCASAGRY